mgnify:CR=1 FL=1
MGTNSGAYELNHECASTHQSKLLCCCEPFLNGTFCDYVISLDNYSLFRRDRVLTVEDWQKSITIVAVDLILNSVH